LPPSHAATLLQELLPSSKWELLSRTNRDVHAFTEHPHGQNNNKPPHINSDSSPLEVSMFQLLHYLNKLGDGPSPLCGVTETEMFLFLALTLQMGHDLRDRWTDYRPKMEQFYSHTIRWGSFCTSYSFTF
jgi:hypothetical protein